MKQLKVLKKSEAMKMAKKNPSATIGKFSRGKYIWHGSESFYVGKEQEAPERVIALWVERRVDRDGPYAQFRCLAARNQ